MLLLKLTLENHKTVDELLEYNAEKLHVTTTVLASRKRLKEQNFLCHLFYFSNIIHVHLLAELNLHSESYLQGSLEMAPYFGR